MIPVKLNIQNFKCYRDNVPTLNLEGLHIACLTGANGHGKSSLLDAITWALWGDAVHRPQDELVHTGQQDMRVELEFLAGGEVHREGQGQLYRVIRRYSRSKGKRSGSTDLQLQVMLNTNKLNRNTTFTEELTSDPALEMSDTQVVAWQGVGGSTVRETERAIRELVAMDYETFVNSAFLVQGRADEFTSKRPAERQKVLGEILGLGFYKKLSERARLKSRAISIESNLLNGQLDILLQQLEGRSDNESKFPALKTRLESISKDLYNTGLSTNALKDTITSMKKRQDELSSLIRQLDSNHEDEKTLIDQKSIHEKRVALWKTINEDRSHIESSYNKLTKLMMEDQGLSEKEIPYVRLSERMKPIEIQIANLGLLETELTKAKSSRAELDSLEQHTTSRRIRLQEANVKEQSLTIDNQRLRREMEELRKKIEMLDEADAKCPLCGTIIEQGAKAHIQAEYESEGKNLADKFRENQTAIDELKKLIGNMTSSLERETSSLEQGRKTIYAQVANLEQQIEEATNAPQLLENIRKELDSLEYNSEKHGAIKLEIQNLGETKEQFRQLQEALIGLPQEMENLNRVAALLGRREQFISQVQDKINLIKDETQTLPSLEQEYSELETNKASLENTHQVLVREITILSTLLKQYENTETNIQLKSAELKNMVAQQEIYDQLSTAFGRTGVQALLLESAIPELESEANRLLGRMTDNTMHLKLETQKENQKGEQIETLEINVADTLGTRSYEMFSGGEAFRINLALRIALSKILASRSGAPLPTLFIDEGFGTQDSSGRERILDTLQSISEDFKRIIVITHLDELKESFPVRIEVEKTEAGATFTIT